MPHLNANDYYSNGKLVIIGGVVQSTSGDNILNTMKSVFVFDTKANTWALTNVTGSVTPSTRTSHSAIVSKCLY